MSMHTLYMISFLGRLYCCSSDIQNFSYESNRMQLFSVDLGQYIIYVQGKSFGMASALGSASGFLLVLPIDDSGFSCRRVFI